MQFLIVKFMISLISNDQKKSKSTLSSSEKERRRNGNPSVAIYLCTKLIIPLRKHLEWSCGTVYVCMCTWLNISMCLYAHVYML